MLLLARSGVAVGEAALMPAAVSMISDLFPSERRRAPTSLFMAINIIGATGAFVIGGLLVAAVDRAGQGLDLAGWRLTLITVGLLGVPVIALLAFFGREPARRQEERSGASSAETLAHIRAAAPLYLCTFIGVGLLAMPGQGSIAWLPTLLSRGFNLAPAQVGGLVAGSLAPASILGVALLPLLTGARLGRDLVRRVYRLLLVAGGLAVPFTIAAQGDSLALLLATGAISSVGQGALVALTATLIQTITPGPMRARLMALFFLFLNLIGAGLAPTAVTWIATNFFNGPHALGGGLAVVVACGAAGGLLFLSAASRWSRNWAIPGV
jgi:MFS family permease